MNHLSRYEFYCEIYDYFIECTDLDKGDLADFFNILDLLDLNLYKYADILRIKNYIKRFKSEIFDEEPLINFLNDIQKLIKNERLDEIRRN
jgi:hypothetical protein